MKSYGTNLACIILIAIGYFFNIKFILMAGLFGLSGALTNQLAIHMLFEKVPFLYGSGIIELKFEDFKHSIKSMIMEQFFSKTLIDEFFAQEGKKLDFSSVIEESDFTPMYQAMQKTVSESQFGGMLAMFGGASVLDSLREPFIENVKISLKDLVLSEEFNVKIDKIINKSSLSSDTYEKIEELIDLRLNNLTSLHVKEIIEQLIKEYLGWIVIWGGFFGAFIGVISALIL